MARRKRTPAQRLKDQETISELILRGWSQSKIGEYLELTQPQICYDVKQIQKHWQESAMVNIDQERTKAMRRLDMIEREAWEAWESSKQSQETSVVERVNAATNERNKVQKRNQTREGNAVFLKTILDTSKERNNILGLRSSPATESTGQPEEVLKMYLNAIAPNENTHVASQHQ